MRGLRLVLIFGLCCGGRSLSQTLTLTFVTETGGIALSGSGTGAAAMSLSTVQAFGGSVPSGVTQQTGASSFTLSTAIGVEVTLSDQVSPSYTLSGQLLFSDLENTWKLNAVTLSTMAAIITNSGIYGRTANDFSLTVPFSARASSISNTISFTVISN